MKEHLIAQFDRKPVLYAILDALGAELDEIEEAQGNLMVKIR